MLLFASAKIGEFCDTSKFEVTKFLKNHENLCAKFC